MAMTISEQNYINDAINRARGAYNNAIETARRNAERMGLNPNSGKFSAIENAAQFDIAAATAATANEASSNWLKTAQAQANEDEAMRLKYAALELERDQLEHKEWLDRENLKQERHIGQGIWSQYKKNLNKSEDTTVDATKTDAATPDTSKQKAKGVLTESVWDENEKRFKTIYETDKNFDALKKKELKRRVIYSLNNPNQ